MTILNESESNEDGIFRVVKRIPKAHGRSIVRVVSVGDALTGDTSMVITCAHDSIKIWRISGTEGEEVASLYEEQMIGGWRCGVQSFDLLSDGSMAALVGIDSTLHCISIAQVDHQCAQQQSFNNGSMQIWHLLFAPDREHFLTVNFSGALTLLDMNGEVTKTAPFNGVRQISLIAYSHDGASIAIANNEGVVTIVSSVTLASRFFFEAHAIKIRAMCFSPDSTSLLTGSEDKTIKLHQIGASKSQLLKSFCGHRNSVTAVRYDHCDDGGRFASCGNDSLIIIWDVASGHQLHVFSNSHEGIINDIAFSFDNQYLISVADDRCVCLHRVDNGERRVGPKTQAVATVDDEQQQQQQQELPSEQYDGELVEKYGVEEIKNTFASSSATSKYDIAKLVDDDEDHGNEYTPSSAHFHYGAENTSYYHPTGLREHADDEEEDELMARARRDLEAVGEEEQQKETEKH